MRVYQSGSSDSIATAVEEKRPIVLTWRGSVRTVVEPCTCTYTHTHTQTHTELLICYTQKKMDDRLIHEIGATAMNTDYGECALVTLRFTK